MSDRPRPRAPRHLPPALLTATLALAVAVAVPADVVLPIRPDGPPYFTADPAISLDAEGRPALSVSVSVPFTEVQWLTVGADSRRAARVEFTVVFDRGRGRRQYGDTWERRVVVPTAAATRSPNATIHDRRSIPVPPGKYRVRVEVRDLNGGLGSSGYQDLEVPDYSKVPVGFADLELGTVDSAGVFTPVPSRAFGLAVKQLAARATLFDRRPGDWPRVYPFRYRILDEAGEEIVAGTLPTTVGHSAEPVILRPSRSDLFVGDYVMSVELQDGGSRWRVERSFQVDDSGPPRGREFEAMLEPLAYVASSEEIADLRRLAPEEQAAGWEEFWRRRDPTPGTPRNEALVEFVRRVRHTERHFQGYGPGWRSDMGRIYIQHGPPEQVETRAATPQMPQLEIWYYTAPYRRFVFADKEGFGRYQLVAGSEG